MLHISKSDVVKIQAAAQHVAIGEAVELICDSATQEQHIKRAWETNFPFLNKALFTTKVKGSHV